MRVSYSQIGKFYKCPAKWYLEHVLKHRMPFQNASAARGLAVELAVEQVMRNPDLALQEAVELAVEFYTTKTEVSEVPNNPSELEKEREITVDLCTSVYPWARSKAGFYTHFQYPVELTLFNDVTLIGYADFVRIVDDKIVDILDLKTSKKTVSELPLEFGLQGTIYCQHPLATLDTTFSLWHVAPTAKKYFQERASDERMQSLKTFALSIVKKMSAWLALPEEQARLLLMPAFDHNYMWKDEQEQQIAMETFLWEPQD